MKKPKSIIEAVRIFNMKNIDEITEINNFSATFDKDGSIDIATDEDSDPFGTFWPVAGKRDQYTFALHYP